MSKILYQKYIQSDEWKLKSETCKKLADFKCNNCGGENNLQTHHISYDRLGDELQEDLQCLCKQCHEKEHGKIFPGKRFIRGGFRMVYKSYDTAVEEIITSKRDFSIVVHIRDLFTYTQVEHNLSASELSETFGVTRQKITTLLKKMVSVGLLRKVSKTRYRLNPYMYLPFRADAETLQSEWNDLKDS